MVLKILIVNLKSVLQQQSFNNEHLKETKEEMIEIFKTYDLPYDKTNYYAKKLK